MNEVPNTDNAESPLYVKVPAHVQQYLSKIKDDTGITKSDSVTLILELASKFLPPSQIISMYDDYMLLGRDGLRLECEYDKSE